MTTPSDVQKFIEENVKGRIEPLDVSNMKQESVCTIEEDLSHTEQIRRATYFQHLAENKRKLKEVLHQYKVSPDEFCQRWSKFTNTRLSNQKKGNLNRGSWS